MVAGSASSMRRSICLLSTMAALNPRRGPSPNTSLERRHRNDLQPGATMSRVLVTGGAGFIGSHVAEAFLAAGWEVEIIDNLSSGRRENVPGAARLHELDIGDPAARDIVRDGRFDAVCHLAAQIDVRRSVSDPQLDARINVLGTLNLLDGLRDSGRATRFVAS